VRDWLRTLPLAVVALAPLGLLALALPVAGEPGQARAQLALGWELLAPAWLLQMVLVAGVAPGRAVLARLGAMARAVVPCLLAGLAIALAGLALVVPGLALVALLSLTGASDRLREPLPAALVDSVRATRASFRRAIVVASAAVAADAIVVGIAQLALAHGVRNGAGAGALAASRLFVRVVVLAWIAISPVIAHALAATYRPAPEARRPA
jgi:hypothetical protein